MAHQHISKYRYRDSVCRHRGQRHGHIKTIRHDIAGLEWDGDGQKRCLHRPERASFAPSLSTRRQTVAISARYYACWMRCRRQIVTRWRRLRTGICATTSRRNSHKGKAEVQDCVLHFFVTDLTILIKMLSHQLHIILLVLFGLS
jgi:hypothetical protein